MEVRTMKRQSKKYYGTAVQAILDTVFEKYCSSGCETETEVMDIVNLLNVAEDMAMFYDLKEFHFVEYQMAMINSLLIDDNNKYRILKEGFGYKLAIIS